jgi:hypothetical protein
MTGEEARETVSNANGQGPGFAKASHGPVLSFVLLD